MTQKEYDEYWDKVREMYGQDRAIINRSLIGMMHYYNVDPKWADLARKTTDEWFEHDDRYDYSRFVKVFEETGDEAMKRLADAISSYLYHMEEATCGLL